MKQILNCSLNCICLRTDEVLQPNVNVGGNGRDSVSYEIGDEDDRFALNDFDAIVSKIAQLLECPNQGKICSYDSEMQTMLHQYIYKGRTFTNKEAYVNSDVSVCSDGRGRTTRASGCRHFRIFVGEWFWEKEEEKDDLIMVL